jgi:hypothetical protein
MVDEEFIFEKKCGGDNSRFDIIFVHGLSGDPVETWTASNDSKDFWPCWLCEHFPNANIYTLGYPISALKKWGKSEMNIFERAKSTLDLMSTYGIGQKPIAFITHSFGGLLTKQILRNATEATNKNWNAIFNQTCFVAFISTPHSGASLAQICKAVIPRFSSTHVSTISNMDGYLTDLNDAYKSMAAKGKIKTAAYYEKHKTNKIFLVVSKESASPGISDSIAVAIDADHINICKPKDRDAPLYRSLCKHLDGIFNPKRTKNDDQAIIFDEEEYEEMSPSDRRDLLEKLIDGGKEHEYQHANDFQNKFAQRYISLGLFTEARLKHDHLLSEVQQRFNTYVYHGKICKGASIEEIEEALQKKVIEEIRKNYPEEDKITAGLIMKAIYYLTAQCHIKWDKK